MKQQPLTISLIQTSLFWEDKQANRHMLQQKIESVKEKTEVVILPEMFSTGFTMHPEKFAETMGGPTITWMKEIAARKKIILTGSIIIKEPNSPPLQEERGLGGEAFYNRLIWMLPNGQYGFYDKRHLFAYAGEEEKYTAGSKRLIASVKGWKINLQICYDLRFPVWARQTPQPHPPAPSPGGEGEKSPVEYDILIYIANWPERRNHSWKTLLQARAIENQCYVIGVNRVGNDGNNIYHSGDSMVIDPLGEVLYHKENEEDIFTLTLDKNKLEEVRTQFPFWKDGDDFKII